MGLVQAFGLIVVVVVMLTIAALLVYGTKLSPKAKEREARCLYAEEAYASARGTMHLQTVRRCLPTLNAKAETQRNQLLAHRQARRRLDTEFNQNCRKAVGRQLMRQELDSVPEIGPRLAAAIESQVFRTGVQDLRHAIVLDGIGPTRQAALNKWVDSVEARMPSLLEGDYVSKYGLKRAYDAKHRELDAAIAQHEQQAQQLDATIQEAAKAQVRLSAITPQDFETAMTDPHHKPILLPAYELGLFAEWETMPDWFRHMQEIAGS